MNLKNNLLFTGLIVLAMATRLIPHAPNFTAVGAAAIFGGFIFKDSWKAFLIPMIAMFLSDLVLNNVIYAAYADGFMFFTQGAIFIYGAFFLSVLLGRFAIKGFKVIPMVGAGIASAVLFYLITNFGDWLISPMYTKDAAGLMASYTAGLPFLLNQVMGTFVYGIIMFGAAWYLVGSKRTAAVNA